MKYVLIAGGVIVAIFIIALMQIPIGIEPLTEVYFENHTSLPGNIFLNRNYNFTFTVHNLEYREMNYAYDMNIEYGNKSGTVNSGSFVLENNGSISFTKSFSFTEPFNRAKIQTVVKKDNNETIDIHFWVNEIVPIRITIIKDNETNVLNNSK